jgi:methionine-S-sulfoxide reductase
MRIIKEAEEISFFYCFFRNNKLKYKGEELYVVIESGGNKMKKIVLAGGCFWGVEAYFKRIKGVTSTKVGYTNGILENPTYTEVCSGETGHMEAVEVKYDGSVVPLEKILEHYFAIIEPTSVNKQGNDIGTQYATGIFYTDEKDMETAKIFIANEQKKYDEEIAVLVAEESKFYLAEEYHQEYLEKNPQGYCHINLNSISKVDYQDPVMKK